jgi:1-acyl-sn-glycerol-3-phosphate acyltransferase
MDANASIPLEKRESGPRPADVDAAERSPAPPGSAWGARFASLLAVRALTLVNDHAIKWLAIGLGKRLVDEGRVSLVLTIGLVGLSLPYVLFSWLAGSLADRRSKTRVVQVCKVAEVLIAAGATAVLGFGMGNGQGWYGLPTGLWLLLGAVMAIGTQAALMTPSIVGVIPELVPSSRLASANGLFALVSLVAVLAGTAAGNWVADATVLEAVSAATRALPAGMLLVGTAVAGVIAAACLPRLPPAAPDAPPAFNALARTWSDLSILVRLPELAAAAAGIVFFWAIGAVAQANVDQFATEAGATSQGQVVPLLVALVAGIGVGSVVTGKLASRPEGADPRVDLGFVPLGGLIMAVAFLALAAIGGRFVEVGGWSAWVPLVWLIVLGFGAGMFDVPLETYLQAKSPPDRLGGVLGATNLLLFSGMFLASLAYGRLRAPLVAEGPPMLSARAIFAIFALLSLGAAAAAVWCAPRATLRLFVASIVHAGWRYSVRHQERLPVAGPVVVVANHVSWLDGFVLVLSAPRLLRMMVYGPNIRGKFMRMLSDQWRFILFEPSPKSIGRALKSLQQGLADGDAVGIFPEGGISRTGQILGFKRGLDWVLGRAEAPIVPVHIDGMWGSVLSFSEGRFFGKWPRLVGGGRRRPLTIRFGRPLPVGCSPREARLALQELTVSGIRERMMATRHADREIAAWLRRHGSQAGAIRAGLDAIDEKGGAIDIADPDGRTLDWPALAATAEAFDGSCLIRRDDRMVSSLAPGDPLHLHLGICGGPLLGIAAAAIDAGLPPMSMAAELERLRATVWLARADQVAAIAALPSPGTGLPDAIVIPIDDPADLGEARRAAEAFKAARGIEPVVAFAPRAVGGLVAMNTPPSRLRIDQEVSCCPESLGRVVMGAVVWPDASLRVRLGLAPSGDGAAADKVTLVVAATGVGQADGGAAGGADDSPSYPLATGYVLDDQGFLFPPGVSPAPTSSGEGRRGKAMGENGQSESNLG